MAVLLGPQTAGRDFCRWRVRPVQLLIYRPDFRRYCRILGWRKRLGQAGVNIREIIDIEKFEGLIRWPKKGQFTPSRHKSDLITLVGNIAGGMGNQDDGAALIG